MNLAPDEFYVTTGTLRGSAPSYVTRSADDAIYQSLFRGEYCYVLSSRQIGKSSLVIRAIERLTAEKMRCAFIDLSAFGSNLTVKQWYRSICDMLGIRLQLRREIDAYLKDHPDLSPLQQFLKCLTEVALLHSERPLIVFLDEIDIVRGLPFSVDELFAAIRSLWNGRGTDGALSRLSFCLIGTATPSDLISDRRITPFNIGKRIDLQDFTNDEARLLGSGLGAEESVRFALMDRVLYWTHGHPCLTQRLCSAVAKDILAGCAADVDACCNRLFLVPQALRHEDNLRSVRDRLTGGSESERTELLGLYRRVLKVKRVTDDESSELISRLKLTGVVTVTAGRLAVRNRIYEKVFDRLWVEENLPDSVLQRERAAYRLGVLRTAAVSSGIALVIGVLGIVSMVQARRASRFADAATQESLKLRELLYVSDMGAVERAYEQNEFAKMRRLLEDTRNFPERGFEWEYWNRQTQRALLTLPSFNGPVMSAAFSPIDRSLYTIEERGTVRRWDPETGLLVCNIPNPAERINWIAVSHDGSQLLTLGARRDLVYLWNVSGSIGTLIPFRFNDWHFLNSTKAVSSGASKGDLDLELPGVNGTFFGLNSVISPGIPLNQSGNRVIITSQAGSSSLWDAGSGQKIADLKGHHDVIHCARFSPDGRFIATSGRDRNTILYDSATGNLLHVFSGHTDAVRACAFSPDSKRLATAGADRIAIVWDLATGSEMITLRGHEAPIDFVLFSPDGSKLVTTSRDGTARVWALASPESPIFNVAGEINTVQFGRSNDQAVVCSASGELLSINRITKQRRSVAQINHGEPQDLALSSDGRLAVVASTDGVGTVVELDSGRKVVETRARYGKLLCDAIAPDEHMAAVAGEGCIIGLYDIRTGANVADLSGIKDTIYSVQFSPDGRLLAAACADGNTYLWDLSTRSVIRTLKGHTGSVYTAAFSKDGTRIVTGSRDQTARVWDVGTGRELLKLEGHNANVYSVNFSPDGKRVVTAGGRYIRLWELHYGTELLTLTPTTGDVTSAEFSRTGKELIASTSRGELFYWSVAGAR